jgi:Trk-type K+ transport system membrane component
VNDTTWFNIFTIIFELVSAYGTVGLSLGVGYDNFSYVLSRYIHVMKSGADAVLLT